MPPYIHRVASRGLLLSLLALVVSHYAIAAPAPLVATEYFVATDGKDFNPGTRAAPFATPGRAQVAVRQRIAGGLTSDLHVIFNKGTYELPATLTFGPEDSGTPEHAIVYGSAPGESVCFSGGRQIDNWKAVSQTPHVWTAAVGDANHSRWTFRDVYEGQSRLAPTRFPSEGYLRIVSVSTDRRTIEVDRDLPAGCEGAELAIVQNWVLTRVAVKSVKQRMLTLVGPAGLDGIGGDALMAQAGRSAFLEYVHGATASPKTWARDQTTGALIVKLRDKADAPGALIVPRLDRLLAVHGTPQAPVKNVHFENITFAYANFSIPATGYTPVQAGHYVIRDATGDHAFALPGAVEVIWGSDCRFERCRFVHSSAGGVVIGAGCKKITIIGCELADLGGNGVVVGWRNGENPDGSMSGLDADWKDPGNVPVDNEIANCSIHDCGKLDWGSVGIWAAFTQGTYLHHNLIQNLPYSGISIGFRWNPSPSSQRDCRVEYNHIHDVMQNLADGGGIYSLGFQPGTVLRGNFIHNVSRSEFATGGAPNNGFFIDEGSKGFSFEGNWVYNAAGGAVRFNNTQESWHHWTDNHFLGNIDPLSLDAAGKAARDAAGPREPYRAF